MDLHRLNDVIYDNHASRSGNFGSEHAMAYSASRQGELPQPGSTSQSHPLAHVDELRVDNMSLNKNRQANHRSKFPELHSPLNEREHHLSALSRAKMLLQYDSSSPSVAGGAAEQALERSMGETYASTARSDGDHLLSTTLGRSMGGSSASGLGSSWQGVDGRAPSQHHAPPSPQSQYDYMGDTYRSTASHRPGRSAVVTALLSRLAEVDAMSPPRALDSPPLSPQAGALHPHSSMQHAPLHAPWQPTAPVGLHQAPHQHAPSHRQDHQALHQHAPLSQQPAHSAPAQRKPHTSHVQFPRHFPQALAQAAGVPPSPDTDDDSSSEGGSAVDFSAAPSPFQQAPYWAQQHAHQPHQQPAPSAAAPVRRAVETTAATAQPGGEGSAQPTPNGSPHSSPLQEALYSRREQAEAEAAHMEAGRAEAAMQWARSFAPRPLTPPSRSSSPREGDDGDGVARAVAARLRAREALGSPAVAAPSQPAGPPPQRPEVPPVTSRAHRNDDRADAAGRYHEAHAIVPAAAAAAEQRALVQRGEAHEAILAEHHVMLRELAMAQRATQETLAAMQASQLAAIQTQAELLVTLRAAGLAGLDTAGGRGRGVQGGSNTPTTSAAPAPVPAPAQAQGASTPAATPGAAAAAAPVWPAAGSHPDKATRQSKATPPVAAAAAQRQRVHGASPLAVSDSEGGAPAPLPPPGVSTMPTARSQAGSHTAPPATAPRPSRYTAGSTPAAAVSAAAGSGASGMTEPPLNGPPRQSGTGGSDSVIDSRGPLSAPAMGSAHPAHRSPIPVHLASAPSSRSVRFDPSHPRGGTAEPQQGGEPARSATPLVAAAASSDAGTGGVSTSALPQSFRGGPRADPVHPSWGTPALVGSAEVQLSQEQVHSLTVHELLHMMQQDANPGAEQLGFSGKPLLWPGATLDAAGLPANHPFAVQMALNPEHPFVQEQARQAEQAREAEQARQAHEAEQATRRRMAEQRMQQAAAESRAAAAEMLAQQQAQQQVSAAPHSAAPTVATAGQQWPSAGVQTAHVAAPTPHATLHSQPSGGLEDSWNPMRHESTQATTPAAAAAAAGGTPSRVLRGAGASFGSTSSESDVLGRGGQLPVGPDGEVYPLERAPKAFRHPSEDEVPPPAPLSTVTEADRGGSSLSTLPPPQPPASHAPSRQPAQDTARLQLQAPQHGARQADGALDEEEQVASPTAASMKQLQGGVHSPPSPPSVPAAQAARSVSFEHEGESAGVDDAAAGAESQGGPAAQTPAQEDPAGWEEFQHFVVALLSGVVVTKHGRSGAPHERQVWLDVSGSDLILRWGKLNCDKAAPLHPDKHFVISPLLYVQPGHVTAVLRRSAKSIPEELLLGIATERRSLDIQCLTEGERDTLLRGFTRMTLHPEQLEEALTTLYQEHPDTDDDEEEEQVYGGPVSTVQP